MAKQKKKKEMPDVDPELKGFDVELNSFGQVKMTIGIEELNAFLDKKAKEDADQSDE